MGLKETDVRTGVYRLSCHTKRGISVRWFKVGRPHQGEREFEIENKRTSDDPSIRITDAASKATAIKPFPEENEHGFVPSKSGRVDSLEPSKTQVANCWEHLRQTFENAAPGFKKEMVAWMDDLHMVFERDAQTKQMSSSERLSYHQKETKPIVEQMVAMRGHL